MSKIDQEGKVSKAKNEAAFAGCENKNTKGPDVKAPSVKEREASGKMKMKGGK